LTLVDSRPAVAAFTAAQLECRETIAQLGAAIAARTAKSMVACHGQRESGRIASSMDCNRPADFDTDGKLAAAAFDYSARAAGACSGSSTSSLNYLGCPSQCNAEVPSLSTFEDVTACITCMLGETTGEAGRSVLGAPSMPLARPEARCRRAIAKGLFGIFKTTVQESQECQHAAEAAGATRVASCVRADPDGRVRHQRAKAATAIVSACGRRDVDLSQVGSCDETRALRIARCVRKEADRYAEAVFRSFYELDGERATTTTTEPPSTTTSTTITSTTTTTLPVCSVTFGVTSSENLGALQFEVNYASAPGEFVGEGFTVSCTSLIADATAVIQDDDARSILGTAIIREAGFTGPAEVTRCSFAASDQSLSASQFGITVVDATTPDFVPVRPTVAITVLDCPFD
jgi:hypothetical protein